MKIKKVTDPEFSRYGRVIDGYDFSKLIKAMEHPSSGGCHLRTIY